MQPRAGPYVRITDVRDLITIMLRALRIGLFIGTLVGMSACATAPDDGSSRGAYGSVEIGRRG